MEIASGAVAAAASALLPLWKCILKKSARAFVILILWIFSALFCHFPFHAANIPLPTSCRRKMSKVRGSQKCFLIENVPSQLRLLIVGVAAVVVAVAEVEGAEQALR